MNLDDLDLFDPPTPSPIGAHPHLCRRHSWAWDERPVEDSRVLEFYERCSRCGRERDPERQRRGRTNRARGNAIEREVCRRLGIRRVGMYGGPDDGGGAEDWMTVQVKSGGAYPERIDGWLRALPSRAGQLRAVVVTDAPGPGHPRRALVVVELDDFVSWFGKDGSE